MTQEHGIACCRLSLVRVHHLRNIEALEFAPGPGGNLIQGPNGAGKTSLLEAIYLLMRGHSFRERGVQPVIQRGKASLQVFGRAHRGDRRLEIGVEKSSGETRVRRDGEGVRRLSEIAAEIPLLILTPESLGLLDGEPEQRRRFVDWGVFHVEHSYRESVERYQRALAQRNAALKLGHRAEVQAWEEDLALSGEAVEGLRAAYLDPFFQRAASEIAGALVDLRVSMQWLRGWGADEPLLVALQRNRDSDLERGFTQVGPHRADLRISASQGLARRALSRGQKKLLLVALLMAQAEVIQAIRGLTPILLLDDLSSELDDQSRQWVQARLGGFLGQWFLTLLRQERCFASDSSKMFHVEQGSLICPS
jgi:DNA replication and repair protein RecF